MKFSLQHNNRLQVLQLWLTRVCMHNQIFLEPVYSHEIVVRELGTGRVMSDMKKMKGTCTLVESATGFVVNWDQVNNYRHIK